MLRLTQAPALRFDELPSACLTVFGIAAEEQLLALPERYPQAEIVTYAIMPNHIHFILSLHTETDSAVSVSDIVCAYKSLTVRECRKRGFAGKLFQTSFHDHVIRNEDDFLKIHQYIDENPLKWELDCYFPDKI